MGRVDQRDWLVLLGALAGPVLVQGGVGLASAIGECTHRSGRRHRLCAGGNSRLTLRSLCEMVSLEWCVEPNAGPN